MNIPINIVHQVHPLQLEYNNASLLKADRGCSGPYKHINDHIRKADLPASIGNDL